MTDSAPQAIRRSLHLMPVPGLDLVLYQAHPGSSLSRLATTPPYWAWPWAGGLALALHLRAGPGLVAGRRVLDLGAGSGLVGIAAARAGAALVLAAETDPLARAAITLNAAENQVSITIMPGNPLRRAVPDVDIVLAGDVFYDQHRALGMLRYLERCAAAGAVVLVGDPGRKALPRAHLDALAEYRVRDMGDPPETATRGQVFRLRPGPAGQAGSAKVRR